MSKYICFYTFLFILFSSCKKDKKTEINSTVQNSFLQEKKKEIKKKWWDNGAIASEGIYIDGKANGFMKWYHESGFLAGEGLMKNDKRDGWWKVYDIEDGKLGAEGNFKEGSKHGKWKLYHTNGAIWKDQFWENNILINNKCWNENGNEITCK